MRLWGDISIQALTVIKSEHDIPILTKIKAQVSILKVCPKVCFRKLLYWSIKNVKTSSAGHRPFHSYGDCSGKEDRTPFQRRKEKAFKHETGLMVTAWLLRWTCSCPLPGTLPQPLTSDCLCVCVRGILWVMVCLSSLFEFERDSELLHKMDFANSCVRHTHRRKAKQFIKGNSRQTTEAKDTSACKCFQMEASFSLHSPQFSF